MTLPVAVTQLFPPLVPFRSGRLVVDARHTLYWEECGNPAGMPVLFLHGGPGGGISPQHRRFFDPAFYRIVLFDQRGAGQSTPLGEYRDNTTALLVADIEQLRESLGIAQWLVFGGSWGSTLALAYGQAHPQACLGFILRGIFLGSPAEIDWFINGIKWFYPEAHQRFAGFIPEDERDDLIHAYGKRLFSDDPNSYLPAARSWNRYESSCVYLLPQDEQPDSDTVSLGIGRLEAHYMLNACFLAPDQLLDGIAAIRHLPAVIVQGRHDAVCPPVSAHRLHVAWPQARLHIIADAGHAALEPGTASALVAATEAFRLRGHFD
ncbi:prolyl aminopeptidase [Actimicrobium sp. CCC2.4]|uniref:prolyl aminopeptidase n=1 Tax=Actimicrobium sp. CCC2.4 TaxID=3048606 RepID=UPI002AC998BB|nr:prolyl aminopeptidase [Actimicrobium sp. CCC2.4]MEB0137265.1 prolyl aminopeptidase [Actimicrobium sp. CCC2.4]WPX32551.1 prolyl aminopeptidase [Actimicrobium sp. CCC2.4]